jgi:hypothetical protein
VGNRFFLRRLGRMRAGPQLPTVIDETPIIFNLRHYQTVYGEDNSTLASATVRL